MGTLEELKIEFILIKKLDSSFLGKNSKAKKYILDVLNNTATKHHVCIHQFQFPSSMLLSNFFFNLKNTCIASEF